MKHILIFTLAVYTLINVTAPFLRSTWMWKNSEDAILSFPALARKYTMKVQEHNVTTEDGYFLKLFRIPGIKNKTVLLMHGLFDSADTFILRGRNSLATVLSKKGYDVWLGNTRGNKYSRRHMWLNPDSDNEFWNFSFHEMGVVDLRVFVDYILRENNVESLSLIGHSLGNTLFYVLGSLKPEYNDKINVAIALGPVCYLNVENYEVPVSTFINVGQLINQWLWAINEEEIFRNDSSIIAFRNNVCSLIGVGYDICAIGIFAPIGGEDLEELEPDFFYSLMGHYPTSTSRKTALHMLQVAMRKEFTQFDHGPKKNLEMYKSKTPPLYDLNKVTMKVALFVGKNDKLIPLKNVATLKNSLPNVVSYHTMEREKFNHIDHIWGKHMYNYLFPHIIELLDKYR